MKTRAWNTSEIAFLRANRELGAGALAELLDRSPRSVQSAAFRARISLRRPRDARGRLFGECVGVGLEELRATIAGEAPAHFSARMDECREDELCPDCGHRPVQVERAGLCGPCYVRVLACRARDARDELEQARRLLTELVEEYGTALDLPRIAAQMRSRRSRARLKERA
jgi:hypothetical protein